MTAEKLYSKLEKQKWKTKQMTDLKLSKPLVSALDEWTKSRSDIEYSRATRVFMFGYGGDYALGQNNSHRFFIIYLFIINIIISIISYLLFNLYLFFIIIIIEYSRVTRVFMFGHGGDYAWSKQFSQVFYLFIYLFIIYFFILLLFFFFLSFFFLFSTIFFFFLNKFTLLVTPSLKCLIPILSL